MIATVLRRSTSAMLAAGLLFASAQASAVVSTPPSFSGVYVFGDSLSDNGNLYNLSGFYPPAPYVGGRFSNGEVAVEYLAAGLLGSGSADFHDLAIGGARTGVSGSGDGLAGKPTGMLSQLSEFQTGLGLASADSGALYVVWGGANDMRDAFSANEVATGMGTAITNLVTIVSTLHGLGATSFLLPNLPDLGLTPEARAVADPAPGVTFSSLATAASVVFNQQLSAAYGALANNWADEHFYFFDVMAAQRAITDGSPANGYTNVTTACIYTPDCATSLYFDSIHPTAAAHQLLGTQMLAAVPEPATVLMMAAGVLALIGFGRRRRA